MNWYGVPTPKVLRATKVIKVSMRTDDGSGSQPVFVEGCFDGVAVEPRIDQKAAARTIDRTQVRICRHLAILDADD